jgi:HK97 family phage portal protein
VRFLDRFRRREAKSADGTLELFREIFGGRETWAGADVSLKTALQVSTALACGRVIAEGMAMLPWKVYRTTGKKTEVVYSHPLHDKLAVGPSPLHTGMEFQETIGLHLAFCSAAYVYTPRVSRRIDMMVPLEPKWVTVDGKWPDPPRFKVQFPDGRRADLTEEEVWYIRGPSWNSYNGLEFMDVARQALGLSMALERGQATLQAKGVNMPGYLSIEGSLTEEQHKKLTKWMRENHQGADNAGNAMILDKAAKWIQTAMTNADAQVLEQRRFAVEEVCRFMRVLPIMVGHADKTATYASAEQMFLAHAMYTLGPWARRLEQSANKHLLTPAERAEGLYTKLNEKALLRMSAKDQADVLARYTAGGIMTRNEARDALELNPLDGLDEPLTPMNTVAGDPPRVEDEPPPRPPREPGDEE